MKRISVRPAARLLRRATEQQTSFARSVSRSRHRWPTSCLRPTRKRAAPEIFSALRGKGIFIRYFKLPRIDNHLRITVGTDEQMDALIAALKQIL